MAMNKKPTTGMKDVLPAEMEIRDYVMNIIKETYREYGYNTIETPCVEHIENLTSKQGGDNEKLIFKILKRGDKLGAAFESGDLDELVDSGLRYDLTVPLCRYYSNNQANLLTPFKALQTGPVWRADRPQKGRFRQFVQCDIDVLGDPTNQTEIETILAISKAIRRIMPDNKLTVRMNDLAILRGMTDFSGFPEDKALDVFITLDKMDKIGLEGVRAELIEYGYDKDATNRYCELLQTLGKGPDDVRALGEKISSVMDPKKAENLAEIMEAIQEVSTINFDLEFDPTLVRGMGYYTGTIFEISLEGFGGSVAGGGRYDKLVGKFTGQDTPACGMSIGFERIITILMEAGFKVPRKVGKKAYLYEKGLTPAEFRAMLKKAEAERNEGVCVAVAMMQKNKKFQKEQLAATGVEEFVEFYAGRE